MDPKLLDILSNISTPVAVAGVAVSALCSVYLALLKLGVFRQINQSQTFLLLTRVVRYAFILALVAVLTGAGAYTLVSLYGQDNSTIMDADLRLVDYSVTYPDKLDSPLVNPVIDVKLRNPGDKTAFVKRVTFTVLGEATFEDCNKPLYQIETVSASYDVDITENPILDISHSLKPDEVDRFQITVGRAKGGPTFTVYKVKLSIIYNEDNRTVESEPFFLKLTGPTIAAGAFLPGVDEATWNACVKRNREAFGAIGYKIYEE